jgi:hypothetical protein
MLEMRLVSEYECEREPNIFEGKQKSLGMIKVSSMTVLSNFGIFREKREKCLRRAKLLVRQFYGY